MSTNKTTNYQLNQWEPGDQVLREEFNSDNAKIDAALTAFSADKCSLIYGTYTGDDTANRIIPLERTPRAVLVMEAGHFAYNINVRGGLAFPDIPSSGVAVVDHGFQVTWDYDHGIHSNDKYTTYFYLALV